MSDEEISKMLADISLVMSDGYYFLELRSLVQSWQHELDSGKLEYFEAIQMIKQFHRLCKVVSE